MYIIIVIIFFINLQSNLVPYLEKIQIIKNQKLYEEGDETDNIYLLRQGEIGISKKAYIMPPDAYYELNTIRNQYR